MMDRERRKALPVCWTFPVPISSSSCDSLSERTLSALGFSLCFPSRQLAALKVCFMVCAQIRRRRYAL